jgi:hypothetical protein
MISTKPNKAVSPSTIGRWIKYQLGLAGMDTSSFSAHSTRDTTASKAVRNGRPIQAILDHGHWVRESTFYRFYHREMVFGSSNPIDNAFLRVDHLPVALFSPLGYTKLRLLGALYTPVSNVFYNTIVQLFELQMKNNCDCV